MASFHKKKGPIRVGFHAQKSLIRRAIHAWKESSPITYLAKYLNTSRYSGDFDLLTRTTARENNNVTRPSQFSNTNMFRRAKSSEWDRDVLNNNISDLRSVNNYTT